ncbi:MAG: CRISPR-associated endonuclease Cas1 [Thermodesulfovibrionales bacterium]|nr:CRISPR-associated endonuclease Cas1 [Thermodesulfovibrionales bacterium]
MERSLYINDNLKGLTVLRDGPSVWIKDRFTAGRRIPARLISRVVIIGNVRIDAQAITLFAENNIPVIFMQRNGQEVAVTIPYNHKLAAHYEEQKILLQSDKNIEKYTNWAKTKRMTIQLKVLNRLFKNRAFRFYNEIGEGNYQLIINRLKPSEEKWNVLNEIITNILRGLIIERLIKADLDPHTGVIHRRHNFGLALDICYIMGAEIDIQALQFFRSGTENFLVKKSSGWEVNSQGMQNILHRFENRRDVLTRTVEEIIDEIFELIRELRT